MVEPILAPRPSPGPGRVDAVADLLLDAVLDGRHPAGSVLPPERELAAQLGVNRTSLRAALTRLAQMGVIAAHQGRGTVVLDLDDATDPTVVARLVEREGPSLLVELFEVRQAMGALLGRLAAERAGPDDVVDLRTHLDRCRTAAGAAELQRHELAFFARLVDAAGNRPLRRLMRWVEQAYGSAAAPFTAAFDDADAVVGGLTAIVDAVGDGDAERATAAVDAYATASAVRMLAAVSDGPG